MLRLALILCAAIYAGLIIFPGLAPDASATVEVSRAGAAVDVTAPAIPPTADTFVTADGRELHIAAVIDPGALPDNHAEIAVVSTQVAETETIIASSSSSGPDPDPDLPLVEITGNSVNLRAGPSTNDAVLGAMRRGAQAELIAAPAGGWVQIRAVETGVEGYMAERFITPLN